MTLYPKRKKYMKVAITGGGGFLWKKIVDYFFQYWHEVISCQRRKVSEISGVQYVYFDLKDTVSENIFKDVDVFIHCASNVDYTKSKKTLIKENLDTLKNVIKISQYAKKIIYISSSSVYQWLSWEIYTTTPINILNLKNAYSYSKYMAEEYIHANFKNENIIILRPRAIYWEWDTTLIPQILKNSFLWYLLLPWNGKTVTSISEVSSFVKYIYKCSCEEKSWIFNFRTEEKTYEEIYEKIIKEYHFKGIIHLPYIVLEILLIFNKNKYSYIVDTFLNDKILK